jgi:drug/metabolite transporter (DMT)-like permease
VTALAVVLVVISAFTHAGWNLIGKRQNPSAASFFIANLAGTVALLPAIAVFVPRLHTVPAPVWTALVATGFFQALYYSSLAAAYRSGDMSVAYPVARSLPVILTTAVVAVTGGIGSFSVPYAIGCVLVIAGILLVSRRPRSPGARSPVPVACLVFAFVAAVGTTGYSMIDSAALSSLRDQAGFGAVASGIFYLAAEAVTSSVWMAAYVLFRRSERRELERGLRESWRGGLAMGAGIYVTYGLVLVAMAFARNVGYIVAFRQLSIPLGSVVAILAFREAAPPTRIAGIAVTSAGLLLIALG